MMKNLMISFAKGFGSTISYAVDVLFKCIIWGIGAGFAVSFCIMVVWNLLGG